MIKGLFLSISVGSFLLLLELSAHRTDALAKQSVPLQTGVGFQSSSTDNLKVILLGSGMGARIDLQQFGPSILVEAGGERLLFDCGRGASLRMAQAGISHGSISRVFLTHLHSDHVIQIPDLLLTGWVGGGRKIPLEVWGPEGTSDMMDHIQQASAFDIHMRRDIDEKAPAVGIKVLSHDISEGAVFDKQGIKVTAFLVDHGPVKQHSDTGSTIVVILLYCREIPVFLRI